jgi:type I restriction enzyme M protein
VNLDHPQEAAQTNALVAKLVNYRNVLRDNGLSTIDYVEQLSFLLFLKMVQEQAEDGLTQEESRPVVPEKYNWNSLYTKKGAALEEHYRTVLTELGKRTMRTEDGKEFATTLGTIFAKAQNKITEPALLEKLVVDLIGKEDWTIHGTDLKGDAYEGLLAKGAEDAKTGAGQYFTPRALIDAIVDVMQPRADDTIMDPACGTGGFLIAARAYIREHERNLPPSQRLNTGKRRIWGTELVPGTARLAAMNMLLHGIGDPDGPSLIDVKDALAAKPDQHASLILANPPFGKKSSITVIGTDGKTEAQDMSYDREDFRVTTTNKQLNFLQHIMASLDMGGRAAVVLPDNVLFEGGAGEKIRTRLLKEFNLHTILRLPTGIFYAGGVKANVLFFEKHPYQLDGKPNTTKVWIYDFRTGQRFTLKQRPLRRTDLQDFVEKYGAGKPLSARNESERFQCYDYEDLIARDKVNLDITFMKDPSLEDADSLLPPAQIAREIVEDLQAALAEFAAIAEALGAEDLPEPEDGED